MTRPSRRDVIVLGLAAALPGTRAAAAEPVGVGGIAELVNVAWGTVPEHPRVELAEADAVLMGETIETEHESAAEILFADGSRLTVAENAVLTIDAFVYNPETQGGLSSLSFVKGSFRFVSGAMPKENVELITPTVSMGIRGTEILIDVAADGGTEVSTLSGETLCVSRRSGRRLRVLARQSVLANSGGVWVGGVRNFVHTPRSLAIVRGLAAARAQWRIRRRRRRDRR